MLLHGRTQFLKQTGAAGPAAGRDLAVQLGRVTRGQQPSLRLDAFLQIVGHLVLVPIPVFDLGVAPGDLCPPDLEEVRAVGVEAVSEGIAFPARLTAIGGEMDFCRYGTRHSL